MKLRYTSLLGASCGASRLNKLNNIFKEAESFLGCKLNQSANRYKLGPVLNQVVLNSVFKFWEAEYEVVLVEAHCNLLLVILLSLHLSSLNVHFQKYHR